MTAGYGEAVLIGSNIKQQAGTIFGQRFSYRNFVHITHPIGGDHVEFHLSNKGLHESWRDFLENNG